MLRSFSIQIILRVLLIIIIALLGPVFIQREEWFTVAGLCALMALTVWALIRYINKTNYTLSKFMAALKNGDYSVYFPASAKDRSFRVLFEDFNAVLSTFKRNRIEKEAQFAFFRQIIEQIGLGIISFRTKDLDAASGDDEILLLNNGACELLGQPRHKYWHRMSRQVPWLQETIRELSRGGKKLVDVGSDEQEQLLSVEVMNIEFTGTSYLIITLQDIQAEVEQKEMEAWHKVIRVLAHEMMNSFTPVSSLAATIETLTCDFEGNALKTNEMDDDTIRDIHLGASTIRRRADGLLQFVEDYRRLTNVPVPHIQEVSIKEFCDHMERLMRPMVEGKNIQLKVVSGPPRLKLRIDQGMIEQVLINIIGNSIHALEDIPVPLITLECRLDPGHILLSVTDNGKGIPQDIRKHIFVPFYTTRPHGSGIGLSLSKSIMKQHGGNIRVRSGNGQTTISLVFPI